MGLAIAALVAAVALGLAFSGGGPRYPSVPVMLAALCKALQDRGEAPPLPALPAAETDLAIRAIKLLGVPGSWPPSVHDSAPKRAWWGALVDLARRVRSGEVGCSGGDGGDELDEGGELDGGDELDGEDGEPPSLAAIQQVICSVLLPFADPESHYLERGLLPDHAAADVVGAAVQSLGHDPAALPRSLIDSASAYALDVIQGRELCAIEDQIIAPATSPVPGRWYQITTGDNLLSVVGQAYGVGSGSRRLELARAVNGHPYNLGLHVETTSAWNRDNIGPTMVSFFPRWRRDPKTLMQRFGAGNSFAVIYLPEL